MPRENRIQEEFNSYRKAVIPREASDVQVRECRRAFYAGALALLTRIQMGASKQGDSDADLALMVEIQEELQDFKKRVLSGVA